MDLDKGIDCVPMQGEKEFGIRKQDPTRAIGILLNKDFSERKFLLETNFQPSST